MFRQLPFGALWRLNYKCFNMHLWGWVDGECSDVVLGFLAATGGWTKWPLLSLLPHNPGARMVVWSTCGRSRHFSVSLSSFVHSTNIYWPTYVWHGARFLSKKTGPHLYGPYSLVGETDVNHINEWIFANWDESFEIKEHSNRKQPG